MCMASLAFHSCQLVVLHFGISIYQSSRWLSLNKLTHKVSLRYYWLSNLCLHFASLTATMNLGSFTQRLRISLSLYFYSYFILTFSFDWTSCIYYFYLVSVRICRFIFCWRLHFEMPWFFLVCGIVINTGLIKVLIKVLYTVIIIRDCFSL